MSKPFVLIKLDREREMRFSNKAALYFEEATGTPLLNAFTSMGQGRLSVSDLNHMVWAGLKACDKTISLDSVIDLIDDHSDFNTVTEIIAKAMTESNFFKKADGKPQEPKTLELAKEA